MNHNFILAHHFINYYRLKMSSKIIFSVFLLCVLFDISRAQGNDIHPCQKNDSALNECLLTQGPKVIDMLKDGIPKKNLPALDPFFISSIVGSGNLDLFHVKINMKNISVTGHSNMDFKKINFDPKTLNGKMSFYMPVLGCSCEYDAVGRMFGIPLESNANFIGELGDLITNIKFSLKINERDGIQYYGIENLTVRSKIGTMEIFDLISINPKIQHQANIIKHFTNDNSKLILDLIRPVFNLNMAVLYKEILGAYLERIPINELLA